MITLITAVPGSGKTLFVVEMIYKILSSEEPRNIYHNIDGLKVDKFPNSEFLHDAPPDWRDTPDGSLVIYDECQQVHLYPATGQRGDVKDERLKAMEVHRHTGHDLIFITQAPTFVHHHVRKLVGTHIHFYRARGLQAATRYEWSHVCDSPNDRKEQERADSILWKFPKKYYNWYKSATNHTHKFKFPKKGIKYIVLLLGIFGYVGYNLYKNEGLGIASGYDNNYDQQQVDSYLSSQDNEKIDVSMLPYGWSSTPSAASLMGCVANKSLNLCQCFSDAGDLIAIGHAQCLTVIDNPIPRNIRISNSVQSD